MSKLKVVLDSVDELDEPLKALYSERDGKFHLTGVEGIKTQADIDRLTRAAATEREEHKKTKERFKPFESFLENPDDVIAKLDKYDELEAAAKGKIDDKKLDEMVETRLKSRAAPLERKAAGLEKENGELKAKLAEAEAREQRRTIHDHVREAASKSKMIDTAIEDALFLAERVMVVTEDGKVVTKDGVGTTPDVDATVWLTEMQTKRPHWWPQSQGGGARGAGGSGGVGNNPFTAEHWNLSDQGKIYNENPARAEQLARVAGTTVGGPKPKAR